MGAPFFAALWWVLFAAAVEVLVVSFFGDVFAQAILRGMGGMRNSPEEDLIYRVMSSVFGIALFGAPVLLVIAFVCKPKHLLTPLPRVDAAALRWKPIIIAALCWIAIAIVPQRELSNNVAVEKLVSNGETRKALDYLSTRTPDDFSPGRVLPPRAFERSIFDQLPACFEVLQTDDAPWVRAHLMRRLAEMTTHYSPHWRRRREDPPRTLEERVQDVVDGLRWHGPDPAELVKLLDGLSRVPEGRQWMATNSVFLAGLVRSAAAPAENSRYPATDWLAVSNRLSNLFPSDLISTSPTNQPALNSLSRP
jgi:hypothetical protein